MGWSSGQSGNPAGRPKGSKDRRTLLFQELLPYSDQLISKAVALALQGDPSMIKLCLDKLIGNARSVDRPVELKNFSGDLAAQGQVVLDALGKGRITPSEGSAILGALATQARLVELEELVQRLDALEQRENAGAGDDHAV